MQKFLRHICLFFLVFIAASTVSYGQFYQGSQNEFGKNRVQYREFLWQQYRFSEYDVYFYEGGQQLASFTSKVAKKNILELEEIFDYSISDKVEFIVYNTHGDFKQSNIGITGDEEYNIGGATRIVGSKVFVYFEGDYVSFERQIRDGIARVMITGILYGGNWRDVIKNSTLLNLPDWYIEGLILYASKNLDRDTESLIRDGVMSGEFKKLHRLEGRKSNVAGYALWKYVAETYGDNIIPNILYMSRVSRNVESGFLFVLGKPLETITKEFIAYYKGDYTLQTLQKEEVELQALPIKSKKNYVYTKFEVDPFGKYAVYVNNIKGQYRIFLYDIEKKKQKKILKAEHKLDRIVDYSFPVIAWHPSGNAFAFITEKRGRLLLNSYNIDENKTTRKEIFQLDKVLSMNYSPNGQQLVFSGVDNGQTDIYLYYNIGNRQERLTNDFYGDFDPSFSKDGNKIIFTSNRPDDTLRTGVAPTVIPKNRDVFAFNLKTRSPILERITDTPNIIEQNPYQYDDARYTFRADFEGVLNRYVATYDSTISRIDTIVHYRYFTTAHPLSNYQNNLLTYTAHPSTGKFSTMTLENGKYRFYVGSFKNDDVIEIDSAHENADERDEEGSSAIREADEIETVTPIKIYDNEKKEPDEREIDIHNYKFEGEDDFGFERETILITELGSEKKAISTARKEGVLKLDSLTLPGARNYNINFTTDYFLIQADNTFMSEFYQNLSGPSGLNPGLSGLTKFGASDLFEDYKISGGFRMAGNFDNNTVMLMGEDLSKRLDKRLQLYRQSQRQYSTVNLNTVEQIITYSAGYRVSWPINEVLSFRAAAIYRNDRIVPLATERTSAALDIRHQNHAGFKGEVVFDNALHLGLNLKQGLRAKVWGEYYKDPLNFDTDFMTFGADARHYTKIHRNLIWANRFAYSVSLGKERLVYYLGGVDNWLNPKYDNTLPLDPEQNYKYQTLGSPMRGFFANSRNGNTFAVINSEIRWPIFTYLLNKPLKSDFLQNFQIIGFGDIGSAWTGLTPYSKDNSFNQNRIKTGNITIDMITNKNPVVYGYGFGLRSRLLGYFVRIDWAWGIDDGVMLDSVFYFSLAMDF